MKAFTEQNLTSFFDGLQTRYDVRIPVRMHDGTRVLGAPGEGVLSLDGGSLPRRMTAAFFPQYEAIMSVNGHGPRMQQPVDRPLFVAGWTAADLDCLEFVDEFFEAGYRDTIYFNKRQGAVIVGVSGRCGRDGGLLPVAGGKCDFELVRMGQWYAARAYTGRGRELAATLPEGEELADSLLDELVEESRAVSDEDRRVLQGASHLLLEGKVPETFWRSLADRCIACTACNLVCPTCTCFDVFDLTAADKEICRWRLWDSCQLEGFAREASGYNPMGQEHLRARRRIHHKLAADVVRWGHTTCYLCGRCDQVCPTGIGMAAVCREIVREYGNAGI